MNKIMVASWYSAIRSLGRFLGSFFIGGVVLQFLTFYYTCLLYGVVCLVLAFATCFVLYKHNIYQKTSHSKPDVSMETKDEELDAELKEKAYLLMEPMEN